MLTSHQWRPEAFTWGQFYRKWSKFEENPEVGNKLIPLLLVGPSFQWCHSLYTQFDDFSDELFSKFCLYSLFSIAYIYCYSAMGWWVIQLGSKVTDWPTMAPAWELRYSNVGWANIRTTTLTLCQRWADLNCCLASGPGVIPNYIISTYSQVLL